MILILKCFILIQGYAPKSCLAAFLSRLTRSLGTQKVIFSSWQLKMVRTIFHNQFLFFLSAGKNILIIFYSDQAPLKYYHTHLFDHLTFSWLIQMIVIALQLTRVEGMLQSCIVCHFQREKLFWLTFVLLMLLSCYNCWTAHSHGSHPKEYLHTAFMLF